jgi:hypothetical protein
LVTSHQGIADDEETTGECVSCRELQHIQTDGRTDSCRGFVAGEVDGPVANLSNECQLKTSLLNSHRLRMLHVTTF